MRRPTSRQRKNHQQLAFRLGLTVTHSDIKIGKDVAIQNSVERRQLVEWPRLRVARVFCMQEFHASEVSLRRRT